MKLKSKCKNNPNFWHNNNDFRLKAETEGWSIFECWGSAHGKWQIQKLDAEAIISDDSDAWSIVVNGKEPHHKSALDFIRFFNPNEYNRIINTTLTTT